MAEHNHVTRDIKSPGQCPGCDDYHHALSVESLAKWLYVRSGGVLWSGETTWQDRHRAEASQWFAYADLLEHIAKRDALLAALVGSEIAGEDCEVVGFSGSGRCIEPAVALRWEDGFYDGVCAEHAERAKRRGALAVYPPEQCAECYHLSRHHSGPDDANDGCAECSCLLSRREAREGRDEEMDESIRQALYEDALVEGYDPNPGDDRG